VSHKSGSSLKLQEDVIISKLFVNTLTVIHTPTVHTDKRDQGMNGVLNILYCMENYSISWQG